MSRAESRRTRGAGQRAGLSREAVLGAARRVADRHGVKGLTMRALAAELGVMPNSLYTYFADKEALLDALIDDLLGDIERVDPSQGDWREGLARVMDSSRRLLLAHPQLVPVFLARPGLGPHAIRLGEITFQLLRRGGLEGARAVEAFRILLIYSLGFAAYQAPRLDIDADARARRAEETIGRLARDDFPTMQPLAGDLAAPTTDHSFHTGLRWLLDGISSSSAAGDARSSRVSKARGARRSSKKSR
jgi:TetR/AcrR family transcriptional regulator, tetracycline repressor protein